MVRQFKKKPVVIEAVRFTINQVDSVIDWLNKNRASYGLSTPDYNLVLHTLEGDMHVSFGDWIIKGVKGEIYPCKPDIFEETYEEA